MKKVFSEPKVRLMTLLTRDIITSSGESTETPVNNAAINGDNLAIGDKGNGSGTAY